MPPKPHQRCQAPDWDATVTTGALPNNLRFPKRDEDRDDASTSAYEREINRLDAAARSQR